MSKADHVETKLSLEKVNLNPHSILVGVKNLKTIIKDLAKVNLGYLIPMIERIIEYGNVPSDATDDYTLLLKFE